MISFELGHLLIDVLKSETPGAKLRCVYRSLDIWSGLDGIGRGRDAGDSYIESQSYGIGVESVVVSLILLERD